MEPFNTLTIILIGIVVLILIVVFLIFKLLKQNDPRKGAKDAFAAEYFLWKNKDIDEEIRKEVEEYLEEKERNSKQSE
jgi:hypothetical protein